MGKSKQILSVYNNNVLLYKVFFPTDNKQHRKITAYK